MTEWRWSDGDPRARGHLWVRLGITLGLVGLLILAYGNLLRLDHPEGDFVNHREFGRRFLTHEFLYSNGLNIPYLPFWGMVHAPLAGLSCRTGFMVHLFLGGIALLILLLLCWKMSQKNLFLKTWQHLWVILATLLFLSRPIVRDFQDGGANLIVVALAWGAIASWCYRRPRWCAFLLGLAVALKSTSVLFLFYFVWKRQWRVALLTIAWVLALTVSPVLWQGGSSYSNHVLFWWRHVRAGVQSSDPNRGVLGQEEVRNLALRPTLGRLLGLPPTQASIVIWGICLVLLVGCAWVFRRTSDRGSSLVCLHECAAVLLLMLLLSPITWNPHCVAAVPAIYLLLGSTLTRERSTRRILLPLVLVVVSLRSPLNPTLFGEALARLSYQVGLTTWSLLLLLGMTLQRVAMRSVQTRESLQNPLVSTHARLVGRNAA